MNSQEEQLKKVQRISAAILKRVIAICDKYDICYYLVGGTALGAVRNRGFIPWDDDLDILMSEDNRNRFIHYARTELPECLAIDVAFSDQRGSIYTPDVTRVYHKSYCMYDCSGHRMFLSVEIHNLAGMPASRWMQCLHYNYIKWRKLMTRISRPEIIGENYWKNQSKGRRIMIQFVRWLRFDKFLDHAKQLKKLEKALNHYPIEKSQYAMLFPSPYGMKEIVPKAFYGESVWGEFEGMKVRLPSRYHKLLTRIYGDYMTPPPENERQMTTHVVRLAYCGKGEDPMELGALEESTEQGVT